MNMLGSSILRKIIWLEFLLKVVKKNLPRDSDSSFT